MVTALASGFGLGFLVAAEIGPICLLCIRTGSRHGFRPAAAIGAGAATIDVLYAALGVAGASAFLQIDALRVTLGLVGAAVLALLGARTFWSAFRVRLGGESGSEVATPRRAYLTSLAATASNPLTIASWAAVFSAASVAGLAAVPTLIGVGVGSLTWFMLLSAVAAAAGRRISERGLRAVDGLAGLGLVGFAGVLGFKTIR